MERRIAKIQVIKQSGMRSVILKSSLANIFKTASQWFKLVKSSYSFNVD